RHVPPYLDLSLIQATRLPPRSSLFPYTTLFRSVEMARVHEAVLRAVADRDEQRAVAPEAEATDGVRLRRRHRPGALRGAHQNGRSEEHTSELQSRVDLVCRLLLEKKKTKTDR